MHHEHRTLERDQADKEFSSEAVMDNDEKLIVSRKYLGDIKKAFKREGV